MPLSKEKKEHRSPLPPQAEATEACMDLYRRSPSTKLSSCSLDEVDGTGSRGPESTSGKAHSSSALSMFDDDDPPPRARRGGRGAPLP